MNPVYEIPLTPGAQKFQASLLKTVYTMRVVWNSVVNLWFLDIHQTDDTPVLLGIPLVTGIDLLAQHKHLGIGGYLIVQTDHKTDDTPTLANLGLAGRLYFIAW